MEVSIGWIAVNLVGPAVVPLIGAAIGKGLVAQTPAQREKSAPARTIQDGQLGWLAVAWAGGALYDPFAYMWDHNIFFKWAVLLLVIEFAVVTGSVIVALSGALSASDARTFRNKYTYGSILLTLGSGIAFAVSHWKTPV